MGDWKSGGENTLKSSSLCSIKPASRNFEETNDRAANQILKNPHTFYLNRNELEFSDLSESQPVHLKSQATRAVQFRSSNTVTRFTDTILLGKVKGSSLLRSITLASDGGFASFVGKMFLFSCAPESMVPELYGTQTITSANGLAYSDDDSNDRTLFTLTGDFVDLMIYNGSVLSFSGTPVADLNDSTNYTVTNVARADANTVSFNLTAGAGGSNVDFHDGESAVTGAAATVSLVTTKGVAILASFGSHSMNHSFNTGLLEAWTPAATNNPELLQWNHVGRSVAEISYEQYYNSVNRVNNQIASPRFAPRPIHANDWAYIGIQLLETPTYDEGSTQARLSAFIDYMDL